MHILTDALREMETNADMSVSSSACDTAQNDRTTLMTINAESEVPSTDQGILYVCGS